MPPFDPRQVPYQTATQDYIITIIIGMCICALSTRIAKCSLLLRCIGVVIILTTPILAISSDAIWGAFPTIDKEGSLLFFRDGVYKQIFNVSDPAHRLIGFHLGHLWISAFFTIWIKDYQAFTLHALINIILTWYTTTLFLRELGASKTWAWLVGSMLGLHLHLFRDINFYTIEKSALYPLIFFWYTTVRTAKGWSKGPFIMGLSFLFSSWINLYWGILEVVLAPILLVLHRKQDLNAMIRGLLYCVFFGVGIAFYQYMLTISGPPFAHAEQFAQRAALDNVTLYPFSWNRLHWFSSIPLLLIFLIGYAGYRKQLYIHYLPLILFCGILSLGPYLHGTIPNPIFIAFQSIPGLWRFAKPEIFFFLSFLGLLTMIVHIEPTKTHIRMFCILFLIQWICTVRIQEEYPNIYTIPIESTLPSNWEQRVFAPVVK